MKLSILMIVNTIMTALFGIGLLLAPSQVVSMYSVQTTPAMDYFSQLSGASLISVAVLTWVARNAVELDGRRAIVLSLFVLYGLGFVLALIANLRHVVGPFGWFGVLIFLLLTVGFGYFK